MTRIAERLSRGSRKWRFILASLAVAIVAGLVYWAGLGFPFYSDDMYHFRWVETHSAIGLLAPSASFTSYRPLPFLIWYMWRHWVGFYSPRGFHVLNLLLHVANGWLVIALALRLCSGQARRLGPGLSPARREWFSWAAGLIFIVYPFSYQAVLWVGALTHVLGAFLILLAVLLYDCGRRGGWGWMVASVLVGLLAPFANEAGLTLVGLVLLYEWAAPRATARVAPTLLAYLSGPVLYLAVWLGRGRGDPSGLLENLGQAGQLLQKTAYFAQGTTFPFQFVAGQLTDLRGVWWALGLGVACALAVLGLIYARLGWWRRLGLACGWVALTVLPPLVALSATYVDTAPRLLYTASAGVAWLWGGAVAGLWPPAARPRDRRLASLRRLAPALALALLLLPSLIFLRQRVMLHELVMRPLRQVVEVSGTSPDESFLFVNVPSWAAYKDSVFPVSTEGVALMPGYVGMSDFIWANTGLAVEARAVSFANIRSDAPYWYGVWGERLDWEKLERAIRAVGQVYVALYEGWDIWLVEAGSVGDLAPARQPLARFDGGIVLLDVRATPEPDGLTAVLIWSADERTQIGDAVFVHLFDEEERLVGQADGLPLANMFPFWLWQAGDVVRDVRWFPVPGGLPPGRYVLRLGLYDAGTGARRPVWDEGGARFTDDVVPASTVSVVR